MKLRCKCGETMSDKQAPNGVQLRVYTDFEWDDIINMGDTIDPALIPFPQYKVFQCPKCERLHFFKGYELIKSYVLEYKA